MEFQNPNIVQSQIVFEYEQNPLIRRRLFDYEEQLKGFFKIPFVTIPVPDNFDVSIPRFEAISHNNHSKIQVSPVRLNFATAYSQDYQTNIVEIKEYLTARINALKDLVNSEKLIYIGYVLEMAYNMPKDKINGFIKTNTGTVAVNEGTVDFILAYSIPLQEKYYLTVTCSKYVQEVQIEISNNNNISKIDKLYGISVKLDINTKYHLQKGMKFEESFFNEIFNVAFNIVERNKLNNFLNGEIL